MAPSCKIPSNMKRSSTKMLQISWKMRGSNSKMLQYRWNGSFQLQNAANCKENGQNSRSKARHVTGGYNLEQVRTKQTPVFFFSPKLGCHVQIAIFCINKHFIFVLIQQKLGRKKSKSANLRERHQFPGTFSYISWGTWYNKPHKDAHFSEKPGNQNQ